MGDVTRCFMTIVNFFWDFVTLVDRKVRFDFFGALSVSIIDIFVGFIILGFVITVFWRGAKS